MWSLRGHLVKEDAKLAKVGVDVVAEDDGVARAANLGALDEVDDAIVQHVEDAERGSSPGALGC